MVGGKIYCCSSLAGRVVPLTFCSSRHSNLDINLGLLLLPVILVISLLPCAHCCISVCLPASPLVLRSQFWGGHGAVSLFICSLQAAGETHEGKGYTQFGQLILCVTWRGLEQDLLDLGTWTRVIWLGLGYSGLEKGARNSRTWWRSCQGLGTLYILEVNDYFL